jgi:hypothetical protein
MTHLYLNNYGVPRAPNALRQMPFLNWQKNRVMAWETFMLGLYITDTVDSQGKRANVRFIIDIIPVTR